MLIMNKLVARIFLFAIAVALLEAGHLFREDPCCEKPILTKNFRKTYHQWKTQCSGNESLDLNCWAYCVFKNGVIESNTTWSELLENSIEKEPKDDFQWKQDIIQKIQDNCKNPDDLIEEPCKGTNDHIETLRCSLHVIENSCPEGMWDTNDPLCAKH